MASQAELNATHEGPQLGSAQDPSTSPLPADREDFDGAAPGSPYTSSRSMIRNLTLPTVPDFNIPPSPPGSPPQRATKKFAQFLELKKKGQHFNWRLETSSVMKDPGHLHRLLDFAGITGERRYMSTLPENLAVPTLWPEWAYVEHLSESRKQILETKEEKKAQGKRDNVDFVKAIDSGTSNGTTTSGSGGRAGAQSAAERIMAGINGRKADKKHSEDSGRKRELEHRGNKGDLSQGKYRSRSRSPGRRRSRSPDKVRRHDPSRGRG